MDSLAMDFEEFFLAPSKTKHPLTDPTAFPTVIPDPPIWQVTGPTGHRTLWVVFVLMTLAFLGFAALSWTVPASKRIFHSLTTLIVLISGLSYLVMATGAGFFFHHYRLREKHDHVPDTFHTVHRQVYWVRYVEWLLTTPLIITDLVLLAGLNGSSLFSAIVANIVLIVSGFFAATAWSVKVKWGWFAISILAYLWVVYTLAAGIKIARNVKGSTVGKFYTSITAYTLILWLAYPIVWSVAAGTKRLSVDGEIVAFAVLDVLTKGVFGAWLLITYQRVTEAHIVVGGFWSHGLNSEGAIRVGDEEEGA
jgi:bacteriorhodopsin